MTKEQALMTREEAINILNRDDDNMRKGYFCINDFKAIEVLKSEEPKLTADVIAGLLEEVNKQKMWLSDAGYNAYNVDIAFKSIIRAIQNISLATCKDCIHRDPEDKKCDCADFKNKEE